MENLENTLNNKREENYEETDLVCGNPNSNNTNRNEVNVVETFSELTTETSENHLHKSRSLNSIMCRICHSSSCLTKIITPCLCKGTHAYVHRFCLEQWLSSVGTTHCELCLYKFRTTYRLRYKLWESLRIWFQLGQNRNLLHTDILISILLTIISVGLVATSIFGFYYFQQKRELNRGFMATFWSSGFILIFIIVVISAYFVNLIVLLKGQLSPWYRWWQSNRQIRLVSCDKLVKQETDV